MRKDRTQGVEVRATATVAGVEGKFEVGRSSHEHSC